MNPGRADDNPAKAIGGFPCPNCQSQIRFPILALLGQVAIPCDNCGLELFIDPDSSALALQALRKYIEGMEAAARMLERSRVG